LGDPYSPGNPPFARQQNPFARQFEIRPVSPNVTAEDFEDLLHHFREPARAETVWKTIRT